MSEVRATLGVPVLWEFDRLLEIMDMTDAELMALPGVPLDAAFPGLRKVYASTRDPVPEPRKSRQVLRWEQRKGSRA